MSPTGLTEVIIGEAIAVHKELGPGLLESTYETCLAFQLVHRGLRVERQRPMPVMFRGLQMDCGYRVDMLVEEKVILEIKSVARLDRIHTAQVITYLKLSGCEEAFLLNFNVRVMTQGIHRIVVPRSRKPVPE